MRVSILVFMTCLMTQALTAKTLLKTEIVEEREKSEVKVFCSKNNAQEAASLCEKWLARQTKSLGERLLTGYCSEGDQTTEASCLFSATGDLTYALKKYRTETERDY